MKLEIPDCTNSLHYISNNEDDSPNTHDEDNNYHNLNAPVTSDDDLYCSDPYQQNFPFLSSQKKDPKQNGDDKRRRKKRKRKNKFVFKKKKKKKKKEHSNLQNINDNDDNDNENDNYDDDLIKHKKKRKKKLRKNMHRKNKEPLCHISQSLTNMEMFRKRLGSPLPKPTQGKAPQRSFSGGMLLATPVDTPTPVVHCSSPFLQVANSLDLAGRQRSFDMIEELNEMENNLRVRTETLTKSSAVNDEKRSESVVVSSRVETKKKKKKTKNENKARSPKPKVALPSPLKAKKSFEKKKRERKLCERESEGLQGFGGSSVAVQKIEIPGSWRVGGGLVSAVPTPTLGNLGENRKGRLSLTQSQTPQHGLKNDGALLNESRYNDDAQCVREQGFEPSERVRKGLTDVGFAFGLHLFENENNAKKASEMLLLACEWYDKPFCDPSCVTSLILPPSELFNENSSLNKITFRTMCNKLACVLDAVELDCKYDCDTNDIWQSVEEQLEHWEEMNGGKSRDSNGENEINENLLRQSPHHDKKLADIVKTLSLDIINTSRSPSSFSRNLPSLKESHQKFEFDIGILPLEAQKAVRSYLDLVDHRIKFAEICARQMREVESKSQYIKIISILQQLRYNPTLLSTVQEKFAEIKQNQHCDQNLSTKRARFRAMQRAQLGL